MNWLLKYSILCAAWIPVLTASDYEGNPTAPRLLDDSTPACPLPTAERLARIAAKVPTVRAGVRLAQVQAMADVEPRATKAARRGTATALSPRPATSGSTEGRHEAPEQPKPRATWRAIADRFA